MPIVPNFTATQVVGFPSQVVLTDTSTGSDVTITERRAYLITKGGIYLVPAGITTSYIQWSISDLFITINALDKDYALIIFVYWLDVDGNTVESKQLLFGLTLYNETFDYYTTQMLAANENLITDNNFWPNKSKMRTYIDAGNYALTLASDQGNAQLCYDEATKLRLGSQYYFNANS